MLVSVIIPVFNRAETVSQAVDSVLTQTHGEVEVVVADDGSSDDSVGVVESIARRDPRVRILIGESNQGAQAARNRGIAAAQGEWLAFLDSDDWYLPYSIESRLRTARDDAVDVVHSECEVLRSDGSRTHFGAEALRGDVLSRLLQRPGPTFPSLLVQRSAMRKAGALDASIRSFQEWDTAIRLARVSHFGFVPEPTFVWDQRRSDTISSDLERAAAGYEQVVRKHMRLILISGGPRLLASHLMESGRWYGDAGNFTRSMTRIAAAACIWPLASRAGLRTARRAFRAR